MDNRYKGQFEKVPYKIKFGYLPANKIYNINGPEFKEGWCPTFRWDPDSKAKRNAMAEKYVNHYNKITKGFYNRLAQSLQEKGCQDPIVISAGATKDRFMKHLPVELQKYPERMVVCIGPGCSRLYWMQKWDWRDIPCVLLDHVERFPNWETLDTEQKVIDKWTNKPKGFRFGRFEIGIRGNVYFD